MDSSHFGEPSLGHGKSGSSRKGKKSNSDTPKQPQRGLGVAQLEKIRLSGEMGSGYLPSLQNRPLTHVNQDDLRVKMEFPSSTSSSSSYSSSSSFGFRPSMMMGVGDLETANMGYSEPQYSDPDRVGWSYSNSIIHPQQAVQSSVTLQFLTQPIESSSRKRRDDGCHSIGSNSQNSDASDAQEVDLDLKLSL